MMSVEREGETPAEESAPTQRIRLPARVKRITISRSNYGQFKKLETARHISPQQVQKLVALLKSGKHFHTPMAVNDVSTSSGPKYRIIDGGHRIHAIQNAIDLDAGFSIEVEFHIYDHLSDREERDVFDA